MEANRSRMRWTYAEFARLPSERGMRHEVIDGELVVTPAPGLRHQRVVTELVVRLHAFVRDSGLGEVFVGPVDVLLADGDFIEPDILFVRTEKAHLFSDRGIEGPPDLIVEVLSPSTAARDRGLKLDRYRHFGVPEYWVVDPDGRSIEVWDLAAGAAAPAVLGPDDTLRWDPAGSTRALEIPVGDVVAEG